MERRSSQWKTQLMQLRKEILKKFRLIGPFQPWPLKHRCSSLLLRRFVFRMVEASAKREWLVINRKGPWEVSFPLSCARTFSSRERHLGTRQPVQGSNPGKPEFFQACVIIYIETNVDEKKFMSRWITEAVIKTEPPWIKGQNTEHYPGWVIRNIS